MEEGPYKKKKIVTESVVCNYCKHCDAAKKYGHNYVNIISAKCKHPNVENYAPSLGRFWYNHLEHNDTDVHTPDWCPVKK